MSISIEITRFTGFESGEEVPDGLFTMRVLGGKPMPMKFGFGLKMEEVIAKACKEFEMDIDLEVLRVEMETGGMLDSLDMSVKDKRWLGEDEDESPSQGK